VKIRRQFDWLQMTGWACLLALVVGVVSAGAALLLRGTWVRWSLLVTAVAVLVPDIVMRWHLDRTRTLTHVQKERWASLLWGLHGFIAAFAYLLRSDRRLSGDV
jgi:hypothetical protein